MVHELQTRRYQGYEQRFERYKVVFKSKKYLFIQRLSDNRKKAMVFSKSYPIDVFKLHDKCVYVANYNMFCILCGVTDRKHHIARKVAKDYM